MFCINTKCPEQKCELVCVLWDYFLFWFWGVSGGGGLFLLLSVFWFWGFISYLVWDGGNYFSSRGLYSIVMQFAVISAAMCLWRSSALSLAT